MDFNININTDNDISLVKLHGKIDLYSATDIKAAINNLIQQKRNSVILDFSNVYYIDSTGIGCLLTSKLEIERSGGFFKFVRVNNPVKKIFHITMTSTLFEIYDTEADVIRSIPGDLNKAGKLFSLSLFN